jgi:hypothetical protein
MKKILIMLVFSIISMNCAILLNHNYEYSVIGRWQTIKIGMMHPVVGNFIHFGSVGNGKTYHLGLEQDTIVHNTFKWRQISPQKIEIIERTPIERSDFILKPGTYGLKFTEQSTYIQLEIQDTEDNYPILTLGKPK